MCSGGMFPRSLRCLRAWLFQILSSGGIPAFAIIPDQAKYLFS